LESEQYIEYSSPVGGEQLAEESHGEKFFDVVRREAEKRIYPPDLEGFLTEFNRENILFELGRQGVFSTAYRLMKDGTVYVSCSNQENDCSAVQDSKANSVNMIANRLIYCRKDSK
jgi:hypothetical protein